MDHEVDEHFAKVQENKFEDESKFIDGINERDWTKKSTESTTHAQDIPEFQDGIEIVSGEDKGGGEEDEGSVAIDERVEMRT